VGFGVLGVYAALWFGLAFWFRGEALDWMEAGRAAGRTVEAEAVVVGGFPFDLRLTVAAPVFGGQDADGTARRWQGRRLVLTARPWAPGRVTARFTGPYVLAQTGPGGTATWQGVSDALTVRYRARGGLAGEADVTARGLRLLDDAGAEVFALRSGRLRYLGHDTPPKVKGGHAPLIETSLRLEGLKLPAHLNTPLGRTVAGAEAAFGLTGALALDTADPAAALAAWRDGGGTLEVSNMGVNYGALKFRASGTMALDAALQPIGAFTVRAEGFFELIDALWRRGVIAGRDAVTAKVVLGAFAKQREGDARPSISLPITLQGRTLYAGPVSLMEVPPVTWPTKEMPAPEAGGTEGSAP